MKSVNVCFSAGRSPLSKLIMWMTRSDVSHASITYYDETFEKVFILEANGRGYMPVPWSKWRQTHHLVRRYSIDIPIQEQLSALRLISDHLGAEYDYVSLLGFWKRRFRKRYHNPLNDAGKLICSEAVALYMKLTGNPELDMFEDPGSWSPNDIDDVARRHSVFVLEEENGGRLKTVATGELTA